MKAMILSAGLGERMLPLTMHAAKPALPLFNKAFAFHSVGYLRRFGIDEIAINLHHQPDSITEILKDGSGLGTKIYYSYEDDILGTAGGMKKVEDFLSSGTFIIMNGDFVSDIDLGRAIDQHRKRKALATLVVMKANSSEYSRLFIDDAMRVRAIGDDKGSFIFCGIHIIEPEIFQEIPAGRKLDINRDIYPRLIERGNRIQAYEHKGFWYEFGNLQRYIQGHRELAQHGLEFMRNILDLGEESCQPMRDNSCSGSVEGAGSCFLYSSAGATIAENTRFTGTIVMDKNCRIEKGASIHDSILHGNAVIGPDSVISGSIIGESVIIPPGTELRHAAVSPISPNEMQKVSFMDCERLGNLIMKRF